MTESLKVQHLLRCYNISPSPPTKKKRCPQVFFPPKKHPAKQATTRQATAKTATPRAILTQKKTLDRGPEEEEEEEDVNHSVGSRRLEERGERTEA